MPDMVDFFDYVRWDRGKRRGPLRHHRVEHRPNEFPSRRILLKLSGRGRARVVLSEQFRIFKVYGKVYDRTLSKCTVVQWRVYGGPRDTKTHLFRSTETLRGQRFAHGRAGESRARPATRGA